MKSVLTNHSMAYMFSGSHKASSFVKHLKKRTRFFEKLPKLLLTVLNEKVSSLWKLARFLVRWSPGQFLRASISYPYLFDVDPILFAMLDLYGIFPVSAPYRLRESMIRAPFTKAFPSPPMPIFAKIRPGPTGDPGPPASWGHVCLFVPKWVSCRF